MHGVAELFEAQAAKTPSGVALCFKDESVTYQALNARANRLARYLRCRGAGVDTVVSVCLPLGVDLVTTLLAIVKTGAAYLAVEAAWPKAWIGRALTDSSAGLAILDPDLSDVPAPNGCDVVAPSARARDVAAEPAENLGIDTGPDHVFSIVYSSGTTGTPQGVMVTARSVLNRMAWMWDEYPFQAGDVSLLYRSSASVGFSWDCFGALLKGVPSVIHSAPDGLDAAALVAESIESRVTHMTASAGFWDVMLDEVERRSGGKPPFRVARTTGEPLRLQTLERWRRVFPGVPLLNIYGATECSGSVASDATAIALPGASRVPVGSAVPGVDVLVLDNEMRVLGPGRRGEVCIGGASLARGYLGRPAMTADRFVPSPVSDRGERVFRTGDLGFWGPDGRLWLSGRRDLQVKVRGFRVEIENIEAELRSCPGVTGAAVRAEPVDDGVRLVGLLESEAGSLSLRAIREELRRRLPVHMVPAAFVKVKRLPRTANGKLDRRALRDVGGQRLEVSDGDAMLATSSEAALAAIWQQVLGVRAVGVDDDFIELGGHSLAAMKIMARIHRTFGIEMPVAALFDAPTVKALASRIDCACVSVVFQANDDHGGG